jgi:DNA-binding transcriptional regulator GbsR (MarR family)
VLGQIGPNNYYKKPMTVDELTEAIKKNKTDTLDGLKELLQEQKIQYQGEGKKNDPKRFWLK